MKEQGKLSVRNWGKFQHYKNRNPPWIKLFTNTFQNYEFSQLSDASKLLAIAIWTLQSRYPQGHLTYDLRWIKEQCKLGKGIQVTHLNELIEKGFVTVVASNELAPRQQNACLETETEAEPNPPTPFPYILGGNVAVSIDHSKLENQEPKPLNGETQKCVMPGCGRPALNGNPFCSDACRDYAQYLTTKNSGDKTA